MDKATSITGADLIDQINEDKLHHIANFSRADLEFLEDNQVLMRDFIRNSRRRDIDVTLQVRNKEITKLTITEQYVKTAD